MYPTAKRIAHVGIALLWLVATLGDARAAQQSETGSMPATSPTAARADAPIAGARQLVDLGPGDSVKVEVYGQPDMSSTVTVGDDGSLPIALIGSINVLGLSPADAGHRIEDALRAGNFLVNPHVTLTVVQSRGLRVSVLGEVKTPGRYPIDAGTTVFDVLALAGGTTPDSGNVAYVLRQNSDGQMTRVPVALRGTAPGAVSPAEQTLKSGDLLMVPKAEQFSIYGEIAHPDIYRIEPGMTVIQAIARAGGTTARGSDRRVDIRRLMPNGKYDTVHAKASDLVQPGDVIRVKESIF